MENRTFAALVRDSPDSALIRAADAGQDHKAILPLLEAELQRSSFRLQRLKEYRNALTSPIYRLHPEILSRIFYIYAQDNNELYNLRWTRLLFVCRRWHDIAIKILNLWSFIEVTVAHPVPYDNPRQADVIDARDIRRIEMQRSRAADSPLKLRMGLYARLSEAKLAYTSMYWNPCSLSSLSVSGENMYVDKIIRILASHRHVILETLGVHGFSSAGSELTHMGATLDIALRDNMPQLQHLSITSIPFDWTLVHGLRSLRTTYMPGDTSSLSFTLQDIINALSQCSELEILAIRIPPNLRPEVTISSPPVSLPHLNTIAVQATVEMCFHLFETLSDLPFSARIIASATDVSQISTLTSYMGGHASREDAPVIRSLTFSLIRGSGEIGVMGFDGNAAPPPASEWLGIVGQTSPKRLIGDAVHPSWSYLNADEESSYIGVETVVPTTAIVQALHDVLQPWPLSRTSHLDMCLADFNRDHLVALLAEVPAATTVVVRPESATAQALLQICQAQLREHGRRVFANILFDAGEVNHHAVHVGWDGTTHPSVGVLARMTVMRALLYCGEAGRAGVPLDTMEIFNEPHEMKHRMLGSPAEDINWREMCGDLRVGFVYEGILRCREPESDGREWDNFAVGDT